MLQIDCIVFRHIKYSNIRRRQHRHFLRLILAPCDILNIHKRRITITWTAKSERSELKHTHTERETENKTNTSSELWRWRWWQRHQVGSNKNRYIFIVIINNWVFDFYDYCRCFSKSWFSFHLLLNYSRLSHWKLSNKESNSKKKFSIWWSTVREKMNANA